LERVGAVYRLLAFLLDLFCPNGSRSCSCRCYLHRSGRLSSGDRESSFRPGQSAIAPPCLAELGDIADINSAIPYHHLLRPRDSVSATPGKMIFGLVISNYDGSKPSTAQLALRAAVKYSWLFALCSAVVAAKFSVGTAEEFLKLVPVGTDHIHFCDGHLTSTEQKNTIRHCVWNRGLPGAPSL
jgi:hypothetical protein